MREGCLCLRVISSSQRPLPDNTRHSQQTNIHTPGAIRTHNLSRRAAADLRLRPGAHWDRLSALHRYHNLPTSKHPFLTLKRYVSEYVSCDLYRPTYILTLLSTAVKFWNTQIIIQYRNNKELHVDRRTTHTRDASFLTANSPLSVYNSWTITILPNHILIY